MYESTTFQRAALARLVAHFRSAEARSEGNDIESLQDLAEVLCGLRELPRDDAATRPAATELISGPVEKLRFGAFPDDLDPRVVAVCRPYVTEPASAEAVIRFEAELCNLLAPLDTTEQSNAALVTRLEEEAARVATLAQLLEVLNSFVARRDAPLDQEEGQ